MRVLVVAKTTNLELHGESIKKRVTSGLLSKDNLSRLQAGHDDHYRALEALLQALEDAKVTYTEVGRGHFWPDLKSYQAVITVGGDGTVLEASHHIHDHDIPLIGVRSSKLSIGKLCCADVQTIAPLIQDLADNKCPTIKVQRMRATIHYALTGGTVTTDPVLNDFLYANTSPAATTRYKVRLGDHEEEQRSSGIWLATPAGSTAAIMAAGGHEVAMDAHDFQYLVREPFMPERAFQIVKGAFDPDRDQLEIENRCISAILALDGQHGMVGLNLGDCVRFTRGPTLTMAWR